MKSIAVIATVTVALFALQIAGVRWNMTSSLPVGLYRASELGADEIRVGDLVLFCPDAEVGLFAKSRGYLKSGDCPGGVQQMGKPVVALPGDRVVHEGEYVAVNGVALPSSTTQTVDSQGRALPGAVGKDLILPEGYVWLLSDHDVRSFDSRYFGAIPIRSIRARLVPLWTGL